MSVIKKANYFVKGMKEKPKYVYTQEEMKDFEEYIIQNFGEYSKVYHELYSPDVHIDILVIPPTPEHNFYKLITEGVGAYKMNTPDIAKDYELERAELIIYLPPEWNMKISNSNYDWVIKNLKMIGRIPIEENSWIGWGHTISHDPNGNIPFSDKTKFCATLLINATTYNNKDLHFRFEDKGKINFYQLIPLYKEELQYKMNNGLEALLEIFDENNLDLVLDLNRKNLCEEKNKDLEEELEIDI